MIMNLKQTLIATALLGAIALAGSATAQDATDYSALSTEQLIQMRSEVRNMSADEHTRFRAEMQSRARSMTPEQREQAGLGPRNAGGNGAGQGLQTQKRDGTGNQDRATDRARDGSRYGDGQGSRPRPRQGGGRGN
jgi:hypothetical protein